MFRKSFRLSEKWISSPLLPWLVYLVIQMKLRFTSSDALSNALRQLASATEVAKFWCLESCANMANVLVIWWNLRKDWKFLQKIKTTPLLLVEYLIKGSPKKQLLVKSGFNRAATNKYASLELHAYIKRVNRLWCNIWTSIDKLGNDRF